MNPPSSPALDLPVANIRPNRRNPRRKGLKPSELQELMRSIHEEGLKDPITVRLVESTPLAGDFYEILGGHRRLAAHQLMKRTTIAAFVKKVDEREGAVECIVRYLHNEGPTPIEEAVGFDELTKPPEAGGLALTVAEAARRTGKTEQHVQRRLLLLELPEAGQKAMLAGRLAESHATLIARLPEEAARAELLKRVLEGDDVGRAFTVEALTALIAAEFQRDLRGAPFDRKSATLLPAAGPCETCPHRTGANPARFGECKRGAAHVCMRPACYRQKVEASRRVATADLEAFGTKVLTPEECEREFPVGQKGLRYDSQYVDVTTQVPSELLKAEVAAHRQPTWQELIEEATAKPPEVAGFDQGGMTVHLVDRRLAISAIDADPEKQLFRESENKKVRITKEAVLPEAAGSKEQGAGSKAPEVVSPDYDYAEAQKLLAAVDEYLSKRGWALTPEARTHPARFIQAKPAAKGRKAA